MPGKFIKRLAIVVAEYYHVPVFIGADFLITVCGNSMTPTFQSGDIVACKRVPLSGIFFQWNKIYIIDTTQGPLIKRIKPAPNPITVPTSSKNNLKTTSVNVSF